MTQDLYGRDHKKTFIILLLGGNLLVLLALFFQVAQQKKAADHLAKATDRAVAEQHTQDALERLDRKYEVVLRERLQARIERDQARRELDRAVARAGELEGRVAILSDELTKARRSREEQQSARIELERRLSDALDLLATFDELQARAGELDAAREALAAASEEQNRTAGEVERLRRQVIVLGRLVEALKR